MSSKKLEESPEAVPAPQEPEDNRNDWEKQGYLREIALVAEGFESSRETFLLPNRIRQVIETVSNAKTVGDFERFTNEELNEFVITLRRDLPNVERQVFDLVTKIDRVQTAAFEVDFI